MSRSKIGKYEIIEELGRGSMGVVYKGRDPNINRLVAIKTIKKELLDLHGSKDLLLNRLKQEAQAAGGLSHSNIVVVYDYGEDQDTAYIAMSYVEGKDLKSLFDEFEAVDEKRIVEIMSELLDALSHAHTHNITHRDIKPANIIVMPDGHIRVTDFGIARIETSELTMTGTALGTPNYMSPEQCHGQAIDGRADIFSAGVILYQFLTREKPFDGHSYPSIMHKILNVDPVPPSKINPMISKSFDSIIAKALAKRPDERYQTAEEFRIAIQNAITRRPQAMSDSTVAFSTNVQVDGNQEATTVVLQRGQQSTVFKPSQESTIVIPKKSQPLSPPNPVSKQAIVGKKKLFEIHPKLVGWLAIPIIVAVIGVCWVWYANSNSKAKVTKEAPSVADTSTHDKGISRQQSEKLEIEKLSQPNAETPVNVSEQKSQPGYDIKVSATNPGAQPPKRSAAEYSKEQTVASFSPSKSEPVKDPEGIASKMNSAQSTGVQSTPSKETIPSPECRSLTESYQLGDPSITPQRLMQACEQ